MFGIPSFNFELRDLENLPIVIRARYLGVCSIIQDGTIYHGPAFRDIDAAIWFLASGASNESIDSWVRFIRLDREPTPLDVPPLLSFSSREAIDRRRRRTDIPKQNDPREDF